MPTPGSVARRFGETLPEADWTHGRAATVTASGVFDRLATVIVVSAPGWALCSIVAGMSDNPPAVSCLAVLPTAICPSAVPPAPSAARTAPSAMYRFIVVSSSRRSAQRFGARFVIVTRMDTCERWPLALRVAEDQRAAARHVRGLEYHVELAGRAEPGRGLGHGLAADLVEDLDARALRRRPALAVDDARQAALEAVALLGQQHRPLFDDAQRLWSRSETDSRGVRHAASCAGSTRAAGTGARVRAAGVDAAGAD